MRFSAKTKVVACLLHLIFLRKILAYKPATILIHQRCLQLRKSLKRKEFGIEKQLIFNKLYAEFLTLNLNWASLRNCHSNGIYKHCGKPNWTLKITLAELSKFAELNFWTEKIKRNFLLVCFSRFFFWFLRKYKRKNNSRQQWL